MKQLFFLWKDFSTYISDMRTLILVRHAKSDWEQGKPDFERNLNKRGEQDAPMMGRLLSSYGIKPDLLISSPAKRALSTAKHFSKMLEFKPEITLHPDLYDSGIGSYLSVIQQIEDNNTEVVLFGHNPMIEGLAALLCGTSNPVTVPTCGVLGFEVSGVWSDISPENARLKFFVIPRLFTGKKE